MLVTSPATGQLRIVSYNTTPTIQLELQTVLSAIGNETVNGIRRPIDILAVQEQETPADTQQIVDMLNALYGPGVYARNSVRGAGFLSQAVIYNTGTVELVEEKTVGNVLSNGNARQTLRFQFQPIGYDSDEASLYLYNSHFKANNNETDAARRAVEATANRRDAELLGANANVIFLGDLNVYDAAEPAFQTLLESGIAQAFDPVDQVGRWNFNSTFRQWHTQSTTRSGGDNRAGGGVNDRFDFQLVTASLLDGEGLSYIGPHVANLAQIPVRESYRSFGNNGSHGMSQNISSGTGAPRQVLAALELASDHLPVVVDYQLPAMMDAWLDVPSRIVQQATVTGTLHVANVAPASTVLGADELDYTAASFGNAQLSVQDTAMATDPANRHALVLNADSIGRKTSSLVVHSSSSGAANAVANLEVDYTVVAKSNASFSADHDVNQWSLDLGTFALNEEDGMVVRNVPVFNLGETVDLTAELELLSTATDSSAFRLALPEELISPGSFADLVVKMPTSMAGSFQTTWNIPTLDNSSLPGSSLGAPLTLTVFGTVVDYLPGDFDQDRQRSVFDLDLLDAAILANDGLLTFDLDQDGQVDANDRKIWIHELERTYFGDANLDGQFDSTDFVLVFQGGLYEAAVDHDVSWQDGDWNGDGRFDSADFVLAFQNGGYEQGPRAKFVPEATGYFIWTMIATFCLRRRYHLD
ncbi:MAG: hypothetical protein KDA87_11995 [Planctomycetales bacterium]|nr:hypothetical protein [Planctomycetales bacterium]